MSEIKKQIWDHDKNFKSILYFSLCCSFKIIFEAEEEKLKMILENCNRTINTKKIHRETSQRQTIIKVLQKNSFSIWISFNYSKEENPHFLWRISKKTVFLSDGTNRPCLEIQFSFRALKRTNRLKDSKFTFPGPPISL